MAKCGGHLLLGMLLVMMLIASTVEILDGQPTCRAMGMQSPALSLSLSLLLHLPLHQEFPPLRLLDDIDPPRLKIEFGGPPNILYFILIF